MNPGQQMFHDFFMERIQDDKRQEAEQLLSESFKRQDEGTFSPEYMQQLMPGMMAMLRPECVQEFMEAAAHMRSTMG